MHEKRAFNFSSYIAVDILAIGLQTACVQVYYGFRPRLFIHWATTESDFLGKVFPSLAWGSEKGGLHTRHIMTKEEKLATIEQFKRSDNDCGSVEVQVALLTGRIKELTEHLKIHKKDFSTRRGLIAMVNQRRSLLKYLSKNDFARYTALVAKLGLRR